MANTSKTVICDRRFARHRFWRRTGVSRPGLQCCCNFAQCHHVERPAFVAKLALVDGDIGEATTAARVAETAISTFGSFIDALINNAGIFFTKPFTDYTTEDFKRLVSTNLDGFIYMTQLAIKQMLAQKSGGSIVSIRGLCPSALQGPGRRC